MTPPIQWLAQSDERITLGRFVASTFTRVLYSVSGSLVGAAVVSLAETGTSLRNAGDAGVRGLVGLACAEMGVLAPTAICLGASVAAASLFLEPEWPRTPPELVASIRSEPVFLRSRTAAFAPLASLAATVWLVATAHIARWFLTRGSPVAAGVGLGFVSVVLAAGLAACVLACLPWLRRWLATIGSSWPRAVDPVTTGFAGATFCASIIAVGIFVGDTAGLGPTPLAIFGVLRRPELDLRPVLNFVAIGLCSWAAMWSARARISLSRAAISLLFIAAAIALTVVEARALERDPRYALAIERHAPLGRIALALDRLATDRDHDGASPYFGGGDCNDHDPRISPLAVEIPGNGVDEDCSGADLPLLGTRVVEPRKPKPQPIAALDQNLILITIDALRASEVGFMGYGRPTTPHLDALAGESVVFERAYALASYTGKALAPMLIGKYPSETLRDGNHYNKYLTGNMFLAERLHGAGFFTMGAASHWYFRDTFGLTQGFDLFDLSAIPASGQNDTDTSVTSPQLTDVAIRLLQAHGGAAQFFLWVHYFDPHAQYVPHEGAPDFFDPAKGRMQALYDGEVWFTDKAVGRLLDFVATQPWAARTMIVVTSDHGESMNDHGMGYQHGFEVWEPLVRVPLVFRAPGLKPHRVSAKRSAIDIVPTLLDLLGVPQPPAGELSGESMIEDLVESKAAYPERDVYIDMPEGPFSHMRRALIHGPTPGMKLIYFGGRQYQLYDLAADPDERLDIAGDADRFEPMLLAFSAKRQTVHEIYVAPEGALP